MSIEQHRQQRRSATGRHEAPDGVSSGDYFGHYAGVHTESELSIPVEAVVREAHGGRPVGAPAQPGE